ncbi:hypothetical protein K490DRAFT_40461 [Saccharata proteae CBS 121410]|uniref:Hypervirulence associated protein TUDOR domain-containing protein n=1 Tax=Saccharata proteae CBS 121410 TaxID=1314787 RepID=A0A9P4HXK3_9PEZI|nr:hypothetical protein K490DRAFT_40461 [Saccharata proteae CBS 121410]
MLSKLPIGLRSRLLFNQSAQLLPRTSPRVGYRALHAAVPSKMPARDKYSDPQLRDEVKEEIHNSDKGGAPGQWSARKAQMMASAYKKRGGTYTTDRKDQDESQKHLSKWTEEEWQTKEGSGDAKQEDGSRKRYLPKKAWEGMSEGEKRETDEKKVEGSMEGRQFVGNTVKAREQRAKANKEEDENPSSTNKKRGRPSKNDKEDQPNKKQKDSQGKAKKNDTKSDEKKNTKTTGTVGSKRDSADPPAKQGSAERLPKKGHTVHWKSLPGFIEGKVVEIVYEQKEVEGKQVKGSEKDPRVVLKSNSSGKIAVHKADAVYFD